MLFFAYNVYKMGRVEEALATKYLWCLSDQELYDFENNSYGYISKIQGSL